MSDLSQITAGLDRLFRQEGYRVVVTADHVLLFTESAPTEVDKSKLGGQPPGTVLAKKRYLLGTDLPAHELAWRGSTAATAGAGGGMGFWVPKGSQRFHFAGGAMLQEVAVPVLTVRHVRGESAQETRPKPATLRVGISEGAAPVTNVETVKFESAAPSLDDRGVWVSLVLQDRKYDEKAPHRLALADAGTGTEQSAPVVIDRAISDDF